MTVDQYGIENEVMGLVSDLCSRIANPKKLQLGFVLVIQNLSDGSTASLLQEIVLPLDTRGFAASCITCRPDRVPPAEKITTVRFGFRENPTRSLIRTLLTQPVTKAQASNSVTTPTFRFHPRKNSRIVSLLSTTLRLSLTRFWLAGKGFATSTSPWWLSSARASSLLLVWRSRSFASEIQL